MKILYYVRSLEVDPASLKERFGTINPLWSNVESDIEFGRFWLLDSRGLTEEDLQFLTDLEGTSRWFSWRVF